jgi:hypothetical protein
LSVAFGACFSANEIEVELLRPAEKARMHLPDDAFVVRGGKNLPESFVRGTGVTLDASGKLEEVSVQRAAGKSVAELTAPNPQTGYGGVPHNQVGVTTVGAVRRAGGDVVPSGTAFNPDHATLKGITPATASSLMTPTRPNPNATKKH